MQDGTHYDTADCKVTCMTYKVKRHISQSRSFKAATTFLLFFFFFFFFFFVFFFFFFFFSSFG